MNHSLSKEEQRGFTREVERIDDFVREAQETFKRIEGDIVVDAAREGESFAGIGQRTITTRKNEIVLRDSIGIWASYTQGPDARTVVHPDSKNVMILGFFTPETSREVMTGGLQDAMNILLKAGSGDAEEVLVIP